MKNKNKRRYWANINETTISKCRQS